MRVGLIAMSGVRVRNPELIEAGLTLPQFVNRGEVIAQLPSLALTTIAACTPPDVDIEYIEVQDLGQMEVLPSNFDLVGLSSYTAQAYEMYELADRFRAQGTPVVIGGLHASQVPHEAWEHSDAVCVGEGEALWPRIVKDFRSGGKKALKAYYREDEPGRLDLAESPMPRFDLLLDRDYNRITVQTVRGCPLDCEFCGASKLYGPKFRRKPVENVIAELKRVQELWGDLAFVELADDNSFGNRHWANEFLDGMSQVNVRWFTETDISIADDAGLLKKLYKTGCKQVLVGLEAISPTALDGIDRSNWKYKRRPQYLDAIKKIQDHGVTVNGCFIVGNDGDDKNVFEEIREFVDRSELLEVQVTLLTPFPGTRLLDRLTAEGRLLYDQFWDRCTLFDLVFQPKNMTPEELEAGHLWLMKEIYNEEQYRKRKRHYVEIIKTLQAEPQGVAEGAR